MNPSCSGIDLVAKQPTDDSCRIEVYNCFSSFPTNNSRNSDSRDCMLCFRLITVRDLQHSVLMVKKMGRNRNRLFEKSVKIEIPSEAVSIHNFLKSHERVDVRAGKKKKISDVGE